MSNLIKIVAHSLIAILLLSTAARAEGLPTRAGESIETQEKPRVLSEKIKETLGITYFSYFFGPGLHPDKLTFYPNQLGKPDNDGIFFQNQISFRYKFSENLALDFQARFKLILNNYTQNSDFSAFRWEAPRIGVSGKLLSGEDWSLTGAINTEFPYFFPFPLTGYQAIQRKVVFTPGMFASFRYEPKNSRWSVFSVVSPRYLFYADRDAAEPQNTTAGFIPQNKAELILSLQPTLNYRVTPAVSLSLGTTFDYRKQVISDWNIFNASLITNGSSRAWRLNAVPVTLGVTYTLSSAFTIFPFISTYPIAIQRLNAITGEQATLLESTSVGMWVYGTLF